MNAHFFGGFGSSLSRDSVSVADCAQKMHLIIGGPGGPNETQKCHARQESYENEAMNKLRKRRMLRQAQEDTAT